MFDVPLELLLYVSQLLHQERERRGTRRTAPACLELVGHPRSHLQKFGTAPDGRIFQSPGGGGAPAQGTYDRVWKRREAVLTPAQVASPLGKRPYDLRHACLSTWLNAGLHAPLVAEWAGHPVEMLLSTYAKCIHGQEAAARARIGEALGGINAPPRNEAAA